MCTEHDVTITTADLTGRRLRTTLPNETTILQRPSGERMTQVNDANAYFCMTILIM